MSEIIADVLRREGGYVDHSADRGGPTCWGITAATLADWRGHLVTDDDVRGLTRAEATDIYLERYVRRPRLDQVQDDRLRALLVDWAIHSGPGIAIRGLQRVLGATPDGQLGPRTLAALATQSWAAVYRRVLGARLRFIGRLVTDDPTQAVFAAGWCARLAEFVEAG